jgi:hypothetical protein
LWLGCAGAVAALAGGCGTPGGASGSGAPAPSSTAQAAAGDTHAAAAASVTASATADAPAASDMPPPAGPDEPRVHFNLDDADSDDLLKAVSMVVNRPLKVDADAKPYLRCVKVTIRAPDPVTAREVVARATLSLRPYGVILSLTDKELAVTKAPDAPAKPCAK